MASRDFPDNPVIKTPSFQKRKKQNKTKLNNGIYDPYSLSSFLLASFPATLPPLSWLQLTLDFYQLGLLCCSPGYSCDSLLLVFI